MSEMFFTFMGGRLVQDIDSITLVNNTEKENLVTVPAGERWLVLFIRMTNSDNVNRDCSIIIYKEAAKTNLLGNLIFQTLVQNARLQWPSNFRDASSYKYSEGYFPLILEEGNTIRGLWEAGGASAGAVDADGMVVCYLKVDIT